MYENPHWTFPGKYKKEGPPEPTQGYEYNPEYPNRPIGYTWHLEKEGLKP